MKRWIAPIFCSVVTLNAVAEKFIVGAQNLEYFPHYDFSSQIDKGLAWAILEAFSEQSGHEFIYLSMPIRRLQLELVKNNIDFVYPDNAGWYNGITTSQEKHFSLPLTYAQTGTIVTVDKAGKGISTIKNLAMPLGFTPVNWQARIDNEETQITWVKDIRQGLALLYQGRVDALDLEYYVTQYAASHVYPDNTFTLDLTLPHNEIPFSLSTLTQQKIIEELNDFITNNPALIEQIRKQYAIRNYSTLVETLKEEQTLSDEEIWK